MNKNIIRKEGYKEEEEEEEALKLAAGAHTHLVWAQLMNTQGNTHSQGSYDLPLMT